MRRFLRVAALGVVLGLLLVLLQHTLGMETGPFLRGYGIAAVTVLGVALLCNILYNDRYRKKVQAAAALLEAGKAAEYIHTIEGLLQTPRGRQLKNLLRLNLTAGYCDLKDYHKAIQILEELEQEPLRGVVRMIQRLNLCVCCFYAGQDARALAVYDASDGIFAPYRGGAAYGKNLAVVDMLADIRRGRYDRARELLATARENWNDGRIAADFDYIEKLLEEQDHTKE